MSTDQQPTHSPSPFDLSSSSSVVSNLPFPPPGPMFARFLILLFELGIITPETLLKKLSPKDVLAVILRDKERAIGVYKRVMQMDGPLHDKFIARLDIDRMVADISLAIEIDADAAERLRQEITLDVAFFIEHLPLGDIYAAMVVALLKEDSSANRACVARLLEAMVEYQAFGIQHETERSIMKSIGIDVLFGDKVPAALRARMTNAVYRGGQKFRDDRRPMYAFLFEKFVGGVSFPELAEHLPVMVLVRPIGAYVDKLGLVKTAVEKPSVLPPLGVLAELGATPPIPVTRTPRIPFLVPTPADASGDPEIEIEPPPIGGNET